MIIPSCPQIVEERKFPRQADTGDDPSKKFQKLAPDFSVWNAELRECSMDYISAAAAKKLHANNELEEELLSQAMMVGDIVDDMRSKVLTNLVTEDNVEGFCFGEVDEYLTTFESAAQKLRDKF